MKGDKNMHKAFREQLAPKDYNYEEFCPHCDHAVAIVVDNDEASTYHINCPYCGNEMMLCTLCTWDLEETEPVPGWPTSCDWCKETGCFRKRFACHST